MLNTPGIKQNPFSEVIQAAGTSRMATLSRRHRPTISNLMIFHRYLQVRILSDIMDEIRSPRARKKLQCLEVFRNQAVSQGKLRCEKIFNYFDVQKVLRNDWRLGDEEGEELYSRHRH